MFLIMPLSVEEHQVASHYILDVRFNNLTHFKLAPNPPNSVYSGAPHCGILTPGRIHKLSKCMFLPFGWKEFSYSSYEVLVKKTEIMVAPIGDCKSMDI